MFNFNFYGWGFSMSNLDDLLSKQEITTDQILDHDNIVTEVKQQQLKFGNFIKKRPVLLKKMIDYIFMNEADSLQYSFSDPKKYNKYPFISSEILGCENPGIIECFFKEFNKNNQLLKGQQEDDQDDNGDHQNKRDDSDDDNDDNEENEENEDEEEEEEKHLQTDILNQVSLQAENDSEDQQHIQQENDQIQEQLDLQEIQQNDQKNQDENQTEYQDNQQQKKQEGQKNSSSNDEQSQQKKQEEEQILQEQDEKQHEWEQKQQESDENDQQSQQQHEDKHENQTQQNQEALENEEEEYFKGQLIDYLMQKFVNITDINTTCIGYFQRIINSLINKGGLKFFQQVLPQQTFIFNLTQNLKSRSMAEILTRLILADCQDASNINVPFFIEERTLIINILLKRLQDSQDSEELENIAYVLSEIINKSEKCLNQLQIFDYIYQQQNVQIVFEKIFDKVEDNFSSSFMSYAAQILKAQLNYFLKPQGQNDLDQKYSEENSPAKQSDDDMVVTKDSKDNFINLAQNPNFINFTAQLASYIKQILQVLSPKAPQAVACVDPYKNQQKQQMVPLGIGKFQLVEFIEMCLRIPERDIIQMHLIDNKVYNVLLDLVFHYPLHNLLHNVVLGSIEQQIFNDNEYSVPYFKYIFEDLDLLTILSDQLIDQYTLSDDPDVQKFSTNNYLFGQLFKLTRKLYREQEKDDSERSKLFNDYIFSKQEWIDLRDKLVVKLDEFYNKDIAGVNPRAPKITEDNSKDEQEDQQVIIEIQNIYKKFNQFNYINDNNNDQDDDIDDKDKEDEDLNDNNENNDFSDQFAQMKLKDLENFYYGNDEGHENNQIEEEIDQSHQHSESDKYSQNNFWKVTQVTQSLDIDELISQEGL